MPSTEIEFISPEEGYRANGQVRAGFPDDPGLPERQRRRIARWASRYGTPAETQLALLADQPEPKPSEAAERAAELSSVWRSPRFLLLDEHDQDRVRHPERTVDDGQAYPLSSSQLAELARCTERQVRYWSTLGLLPLRRNQRNERQFGPGAAITAIWLQSNGQKAVTTLSAYSDFNGTVELLAATAPMLHTQAEAAGGEAKELLDELADLMESTSLRLMAVAAAGP